jgi:hypothetical protein
MAAWHHRRPLAGLDMLLVGIDVFDGNRRGAAVAGNESLAV